jgi:hypothetical protein
MASKPNWQTDVAQVIYRAYPDSDLLPVDPPMAGETIGDFALRAEGAGDTLFLFLCREANDDIDADEYLHRLDRALRDIEQVHDAFADLVADATPRLPSSPGSIA